LLSPHAPPPTRLPTLSLHDALPISPPPGPYRRTDVVRGADAALAQPQLEPQIEIGCVDADHQIRSPVQEVGAQRAAHSQQLRQALERLDKSHHGETLDIEKAGRSEERRVGKECKSRGSPYR